MIELIKRCSFKKIMACAGYVTVCWVCHCVLGRSLCQVGQCVLVGYGVGKVTVCWVGYYVWCSSPFVVMARSLCAG